MTLAEYIQLLGKLAVQFALFAAQQHDAHPDLWPKERSEEEWHRMFAVFCGVEVGP